MSSLERKVITQRVDMGVCLASQVRSEHSPERDNRGFYSS
jgi:hypothetical protein